MGARKIIICLWATVIIIFANGTKTRFKRSDDGIGSDITYDSAGLRSTFHGLSYQIKVLMLIMIRKHNENDYFQLATEFNAAEKFDDAVLKYVKNNKDTYLCVQAKHKIDEKDNAITLNDLRLTRKNAEFNMQKYFKSFLKMKKTNIFDSNNLKELLILTNIDFDAIIKNPNFKYVREIFIDPNHVLQLKEGKFYKMEPEMRKALEDIFYAASDQLTLFGKIVELLTDGKRFDLRDPFLKEYYGALIEHKIIDLKAKALHSDFVNGLNDFAINGKHRDFHEAFINYLNKKHTLQDLAKRKFGWSAEFGKKFDPVDLPKDLIQAFDIDEFCEKMIFAVDQPNEMKLENHIKQELLKKYSVINANRMYNALYVEICKWLAKPEGTQITLGSANKKFQELRKEIFKPIQQYYQVKKEFVGRETQLQELRTNIEIHKKTTVINGIGGIGKTQLAAKFAENFKSEHPEDNIVWINMASEQSVEKSFVDIAKSPKCQIPIDNLNTKQIVNAVYDFFKNTNTLFVFDDVRDPTHLYDEYKPMQSEFPVLITSRYKDWDSHSTIELKVFTDTEAKKFVENYLIGPKEPQHVQLLVEKMEKFPLAMQQAVAYINNQRKKPLTTDYSIVKYLQEFDMKFKKILDHAHYDRAANEPYKLTLYTTWTMTEDIIKSLHNGETAMFLLNLMSLMPTDVPLEVLKDHFQNHEKYPNANDAFALLSDYSMIDVENHQTKMHKLVQVITKTKMGIDEQELAISELLTLVRNDKTENLDIAMNMWFETMELPNRQSEAYHFTVRVAMLASALFQDHNKYIEQYNVLEKTHKMVVDKNLPLDADIVLLKMTLAEVYKEKDLLSESQELFKEVAQINDENLLKDYDILFSVARSNQQTKNHGKAIEFYEAYIKTLTGEEKSEVQFLQALSMNEMKRYTDAHQILIEVKDTMQNLGQRTILVDFEIIKTLKNINNKEAIEKLTDLIKEISIGDDTLKDIIDVTDLTRQLNKLKGKERISQESEAKSLPKCLKQGRRRRSTGNCLFTREDVNKFIEGDIIDYKKFLKFLKKNPNEKMNAQLLDLVKNNYEVNDHNFDMLMKSVTEYGGFEHLNVDERMHLVAHDAYSVPKWKTNLMRGANSVMMVHGVYGSIVTCTRDISSHSCIQSAAGIGWSVANLEKGLIKSQVKLYRGIGASLGALFDVIDIGVQIKNLVDCHKRKGTASPCSEREIRDSIVSLSIDGVSIVTGVTFAVLGMTGVGLVVGFGLFAIQIIYSGVSAVEEFKKKYHSTLEEDLSIFWRTSLFFDMAHDVKALASRTELVQSHARTVWAILQNQTTEVHAFGMGLGYIESENRTRKCAATMVLDVERNNIELSRVVPEPVDDNVEMICLPMSTLKDFEKDIHGNIPSAKYYCENAMVFADKRRHGKYVVLNLELVDIGIISGSNKWHNIFMIYDSQEPTVSLNDFQHRSKRFSLLDVGDFFSTIRRVIKDAVTTEFHISDVNSGKVYEPIGLNVYGGNSVTNRFMMLKFPTSVRLYGGVNADNLIDFSDTGNY